MTTTARTAHHYYWVSPRGFANEGTVYAVPSEHVAAAEKRLWDLYSDNVNARYYRITAKRALSQISRERASWAHTEEWGMANDAYDQSFLSRTVRAQINLADVVKASSWLWETS